MSEEKNSFINIELIPKELITNIFGPASTSIGQGLGGIANFVMGPLRRLNITSEKSYQDFVEKINTKTDEIPPENRDITKLGLSLKTMEDSRYQLEDEEMREYFANLLAGLVDNRKNQKASPRFSTILSELTTKDANILSKIYTLTAVPTANIRVQRPNGEGVDTIKNLILLSGSKYINSNSSLQTLESYGLIEIRPQQALADKADQALYDAFENSYFLKNMKLEFISRFEKNPFFIDRELTVVTVHGSLRISDLGEEFCSMIFSSQQE